MLRKRLLTFLTCFAFVMTASVSFAECLNGDPNCNGGYLPGAPQPTFDGGVSQQTMSNIATIAVLAMAMNGNPAAGALLGPMTSTALMGTPSLTGSLFQAPVYGDGVNDGTAQ